MSEALRTFQQIGAAAFDAAKHIEEAAHQEYRHLEQRSGYWAMIDLKGSAAYRQKHGAESALKRAVVLSDLFYLLTSGYAGSISIFKELGDGLLVSASDFRPLVEVILVMDAVRGYWNVDVEHDEAYLSLESRTAITFGEAHVLGSDYLGGAIDEVARLSAYKVENPSRIAIVSSDVRSRAEAQFEREYGFLRFGESFEMPSGISKAGERPLWASELIVDRSKRRDFADFFVGARAALLGISKSTSETS